MSTSSEGFKAGTQLCRAGLLSQGRNSLPCLPDCGHCLAGFSACSAPRCPSPATLLTLLLLRIPEASYSPVLRVHCRKRKRSSAPPQPLSLLLLCPGLFAHPASPAGMSSDPEEGSDRRRQGTVKRRRSGTWSSLRFQ